MRAMEDQIDEQPKIIKLFSINYARDLMIINTHLLNNKKRKEGKFNRAILKVIVYIENICLLLPDRCR
jgi:hypothetical protein